MTKIISVTDELYERLKAMKRNGESFSDDVAWNARRKGNKEKVMKMFGSQKEEWKDVDALEYVKEVRKNWKWDRYV
tara:strand:- start:3660 stop:3887 length:228 start_codon:yes stop_codon:yes gene_type:complete